MALDDKSLIVVKGAPIDGKQEMESVPLGEEGDTPIQGPTGEVQMKAPVSNGTESYKFNSSAGAPSSGQITFDDSIQDDSLKVRIHKTNADGVDLSNYFLSAVELGDSWYMQDQKDSTAFKAWAIVGDTDMGSYIEYDVTPISLGEDLPNNKKLLLTLNPAGAVSNNLKDGVYRASGGSPTLIDANPEDSLLYWDSDGGQARLTSIRGMLAKARLDAYVRGSATNIVTSSTPTALTIFDTDYFSSTMTGFTKSADDSGVTANVPVRYRVMCLVTLASGASTDFMFQIYVGGNPVGRVVDASGDGSGKYTNMAIAAITGIVVPGSKIELRVSNNGDTITEIGADMFVEYAG